MANVWPSNPVRATSYGMENPFIKLIRKEGEVLAEDNEVAYNNSADSEDDQRVGDRKEE